MCKIKPYPPRVGGAGAPKKSLPGFIAAGVDTVGGVPKSSALVDLRNQLPAPTGATGDSVAIAVGDVLTWQGNITSAPAAVTFAQARQNVFNGNATDLPLTLSAWRAALAGGSVILAEMYVDEYFLSADVPLTGAGAVAGDRIVTALNDQLANPTVQTVIVVGSFVDAADHHSEHPTGRYLVRSGFGPSWGNNGVAWVSQSVTRYRFIDGFSVKRP
jgi:hypothetical protein